MSYDVTNARRPQAPETRPAETKQNPTSHASTIVLSGGSEYGPHDRDDVAEDHHRSSADEVAERTP